MNEVEKMYENADVNKDCNLYKHFTECPMKHTQCEDCENFVYPPFTAEKQLELIKWLSTKELKIRTNKQSYAIYIGILGNDNTCFFGCEGLYFEQTLAEVINNLWQDLTDAERTQIKEILE